MKTCRAAKVRFVAPKHQLVEGVEAENVRLVGDFNARATEATPMEQRKIDAAFHANLHLAPGRRYEFRYLAKGEQRCNDW